MRSLIFAVAVEQDFLLDVSGAVSTLSAEYPEEGADGTAARAYARTS
jgi:hypothetical protein